MISGNSDIQVAIVETATSNNIVQGNFIGPSAAGTSGITSTSGGVDMTSLGAGDWRPDYRKSFPNAATSLFDR